MIQLHLNFELLADWVSRTSIGPQQDAVAVTHVGP